MPKGVRLTLEDVDILFTSLGLKRIGAYKNNHENIDSECIHCGYSFTRPYGLLKRKWNGCPGCRFKEEGQTIYIPLFEKYGFKITGEYVNHFTSVDCECMRCGRENHKVPRRLFNALGVG